MRRPRRLLLALLIPVLLAGASWVHRAAQAEDPPVADPAVARKAMSEAVKRGQTLWRQKWSPEGKACFECHNQGPNRMISRRIKAYPKYDFGLQKVVTVQEKMRQMIELMSKGKAPALGHADLTALEAYVSTVRR